MIRQLRLTPENLSAWLRERELISPGDEISVEQAGEGNINWVRRARVTRGPGAGRSWVVKQARPTLERFPEYAAPIERAVREARYYETVGGLGVGGLCPQVIDFDPEHCVLVLEDLGAAQRLDAAMASGADVRDTAVALGRFLGRVHTATHERRDELSKVFENEAMKRLHGEHIFHLPYRPNDFPLSDSVSERAQAVWRDEALVATIDRAYARYLGESPASDDVRAALVHADVQPGNVLLSDTGPKLLDPEIAHVGDPAFDVGILLAHLALPGLASGQSAAGRGAVDEAWDAYVAEGGAALVRFETISVYAGIELLRRTLGAARVAAVATDAASLRVVDRGLDLVRSPAREASALVSS